MMMLLFWLSDSSRGLISPSDSFHFSFFSVPVPEIQKSVFRIPHEKYRKPKIMKPKLVFDKTTPKAFFKVTYA
jgi:hypothetical protein